ncbi:hypothetical protein AMET1_0428 [Methanonatronarchaeum thermophilum]|uniref:Uncharacterized protein n=1 Tax=Methanonatronarchaeum thermophilum TaxID=1927129 RepID=A0A1Y3GBZ5_9EURY|nr:hypothetical protein [Methanonatronarchaeum thermophilum]OUJ18777.1 hypothetical protein AMET1_0428 [Methanonatronarchaeum thermophilum]
MDFGISIPIREIIKSVIRLSTSLEQFRQKDLDEVIDKSIKKFNYEDVFEDLETQFIGKTGETTDADEIIRYLYIETEASDLEVEEDCKSFFKDKGKNPDDVDKKFYEMEERIKPLIDILEKIPNSTITSQEMKDQLEETDIESNYKRTLFQITWSLEKEKTDIIDLIEYILDVKITNEEGNLKKNTSQIIGNLDEQIYKNIRGKFPLIKSLIIYMKPSSREQELAKEKAKIKEKYHSKSKEIIKQLEDLRASIYKINYLMIVILLIRTKKTKIIEKETEKEILNDIQQKLNKTQKTQ